MMIFIALAATANLIWAITGTAVRPPIIGFAGITCGFLWGLVLAMHSIGKAGL